MTKTTKLATQKKSYVANREDVNSPEEIAKRTAREWATAHIVNHKLASIRGLFLPSKWWRHEKQLLSLFPDSFILAAENNNDVFDEMIEYAPSKLTSCRVPAQPDLRAYHSDNTVLIHQNVYTLLQTPLVTDLNTVILDAFGFSSKEGIKGLQKLADWLDDSVRDVPFTLTYQFGHGTEEVNQHWEHFRYTEHAENPRLALLHQLLEMSGKRAVIELRGFRYDTPGKNGAIIPMVLATATLRKSDHKPRAYFQPSGRFNLLGPMCVMDEEDLHLVQGDREAISEGLTSSAKRSQSILTAKRGNFLRAHRGITRLTHDIVHKYRKKRAGQTVRILDGNPFNCCKSNISVNGVPFEEMLKCS